MDEDALKFEDLVFVKIYDDKEDIYKGLVHKMDERFLYLSVTDGLLIINIDKIDTIFRPSKEALSSLIKDSEEEGLSKDE